MAQAARPDWIDHAIARLAAAEAEVESLSAQIRSVLTDLTKNATSRVKTLFEMSQHRVEREDLIDHLHAGKRIAHWPGLRTDSPQPTAAAGRRA